MVKMKLKVSVITLDKRRRADAYMSRDDYFEQYSVLDNSGCFKCLAKGAPVLININGSTYLSDKLPVIGNKAAFDDFCRELRSPTTVKYLERVIFVWR